ncbi:hypothetical protein B9Z55_027731 [Caenorhabditis nigoni]|uniref:Serpentine receptor class gamma n=1 Tax=Caenorhabditis nigoni TaxID=1611254 RepID=A0A2G5SEG8_9PELO|nr:hypothetical protein B9Z55_027731 [Caenorhabditis nigoni]
MFFIDTPLSTKKDGKGNWPLVYYITLNSVLFLCAALYIPMVISIRKLQHLASSIKNKPHKYIMYQTTLIITFKIAQLFATLLFVFDGETFSDNFPFLCSLDMISTPLTIQLSYLLCNKKTLADVRKRSTLRSFYRIIFKKSTVDPSVQDATTSVPAV